MKNRSIQFKPTAGLLISLLLTCFAAVFISATTSAKAGEMVPFNGTVSGYVESQSGTECEPSIHVVNFGNANHLGAFTGTAEFFPRPCEPDPDLCQNNIPYTGTFDWFAANGDEITGHVRGVSVPDRNARSLRQPLNRGRRRRAQVGLLALRAILSSADNWTSPRFRPHLSSPGKGPSQASARRDIRDCASDLRIATSVRLVAMR